MLLVTLLILALMAAALWGASGNDHGTVVLALSSLLVVITGLCAYSVMGPTAEVAEAVRTQLLTLH